MSGLVEGRVYLAADDGATGCVLATALVSAAGFRVVGQADPETLAAEEWAALPVAARERALAWQRHIREIETGLPGGPGSGGAPRLEYDPRRFTLAEREHAKAAELAALGWRGVSRVTVQRMRLNYHRQGLLALVDGRSLRRRAGTGRADERVVAAVLEALRLCRGRRATTVKQIIERAEQIVAQRHGRGRVKLPARASMYRLVKALSDPAEPPGSPARTATGRWRASGAPPALRPAERVQVATAALGVPVVGEDGLAVAVSVTAAVDGATGCVLAAVVHDRQAVPVQLPVLLAEMAVPCVVRPGWREMLRAAHESLPGRLMGVEARLEAAAVRPVAVPETLVFDPATAAAGSWLLSVCESLGVSLEAVSARQEGRAVAETVRRLAGLFTRHAAAVAAAVAAAARPAGPGGDGPGQPPGVLGMLHLQDVLDEWITAVWHTRLQETLRHPLMPGAVLCPREMWQVLLGAAGVLPLPLGARHFAELLPARRHAVTEAGVRLGRRRYDAACLDEHRGRSCPTTDDGRWEVHHHPYDVRQVHIRLPDGELHPLAWTDSAHSLRPLDATVRQRTAQTVAARTHPAGDQPASAGEGSGAAQWHAQTEAVLRAGPLERGPGVAEVSVQGHRVSQEVPYWPVWDAKAEARQW
ncbi:transposase [Streptomyces sp. NRRL S-1521]|uniref:transposase n=1 Tax=Streptomyces sp. NRRL S-1521 TaxID=1609100 RepID=UPI00131E0241|nr:transposase [Streptomyces sp. NRRL S-1521]